MQQLLSPSWPTTATLAERIAATRPRPHHAALLATLAKLLPDLDFQYRRSLAGWYRSGAVRSPGGSLLDASLEDWLQSRYQQHDEDFAALLGELIELQPVVTRLNGCHHYFVAQYAPGASSFWQIEVEELQEVFERRLLPNDPHPADLQDLLEPLQPASITAQPVAAPRYRLSRLVDVRALLDGQDVGEPVQRFVREWQIGSAADQPLCRHWLVQQRESLDVFHQRQTQLAMLAVRERPLQSFPWNLGETGLALAVQLQAFERLAGYRGAWYFHLVAGAGVPAELAQCLLADAQAGFHYLPDREAALLERWMESPYAC
jgi:hypothetical protein